MKRFEKLLLAVLVLASCSKEGPSSGEVGPVAGTLPGNMVYHGEILLGRKLENPYSLKNIKASLADLQLTRASAELAPNKLYVRFLPKDADEYSLLSDQGVDMFDHPMDREILRDGDYWHDPSIPDDEITWQYACVPVDFEFPSGIRHEILDECLVPDDEIQTKGASDVDWDRVERHSFILTGNEAMLAPETRASKSSPSGRITIVDSSLKGSSAQGVAGVKVTASTFVKVASAFTDSNGEYSMTGKFSSKPQYKLCFKNQKGFSIGLNLILVPASVSSLGKGSPDGEDFKVDKSSDDALFRRCAVNNAAYDYYSKCESEGIASPASNIRFWILGSLKASCTMMMHHGALIDINLAGNYMNIYKAIIRVVSPDITIGAKKISDDYAALYSVTVHELAHASHFQKVGTSYWGTLTKYVLESFLITGSCYGTGNGDDAGCCEVSEMWAYYVEHGLFKQRYGVDPGYQSYWFHPQILDEVEAAGLNRAQICSVLDRDVKDVAALKSALCAAYPDKKTKITQAFKLYSK